MSFQELLNTTNEKTYMNVRLQNLNIDGIITYHGTPIGPTAGFTGLFGETGPTGPTGLDGSSVLSGNGAPDGSLGFTGDFYINKLNYSIYGPKLSGLWGSSTSLIGPTGPRGNSILNGNGPPDNSIGINGDFYINKLTEDIYGPKSSGLWGSSTSLIGPDGSIGPIGPTGNTGMTGNAVLNGNGAPSSMLGRNGDFYINNISLTIYGPKSDLGWGLPTNLIGPNGVAGSIGPSGPTGATGNSVLNGNGIPNNSLGKNGDFYINVSANTIYGPKSSGSWGSPTSLIGPIGPTGPRAGGTGMPDMIRHMGIGSNLSQFVVTINDVTDNSIISVRTVGSVIGTSTRYASYYKEYLVKNTGGNVAVVHTNQLYAYESIGDSYVQPAMMTPGSGNSINFECYGTLNYNVNYSVYVQVFPVSATL